MIERNEGKYYEMRAPWIPRATFLCVEIVQVEPDKSVKKENMIPVFQGDSSSADLLFGYSQVKKGMSEGRMMGILFNPEEEVKYPDGSDFAD